LERRVQRRDGKEQSEPFLDGARVARWTRAEGSQREPCYLRYFFIGIPPISLQFRRKTSEVPKDEHDFGC